MEHIAGRPHPSGFLSVLGKYHYGVAATTKTDKNALSVDSEIPSSQNPVQSAGLLVFSSS